ncbi:MAG: aldolase/citrate lyase family protein [Burkholderiales bacterium]
MRPARATLDELLARDSPRIVGTWSQIASGDVVDALGAAGFDFTIVDCEHGAFGIETAESMIRMCESAGLVPLVRVPRGDTTMIGKALDAGAAGVLAPSVQSPEEARGLVAAARFAPHGRRGACPIVRAADHSAMRWSEFTIQQEGNGVIAMIETAAGLACCEAICRVPGLKALLIGPFDLSVSLGHPGDLQHRDVVDAVHRLIAASRAASLPVIFPVFARERDAFEREMAHWSAAGVRVFAVGADKIMLADALAQYRSWSRKA